MMATSSVREAGGESVKDSRYPDTDVVPTAAAIKPVSLHHGHEMQPPVEHLQGELRSVQRLVQRFGRRDREPTDRSAKAWKNSGRPHNTACGQNRVPDEDADDVSCIGRILADP